MNAKIILFVYNWLSKKSLLKVQYECYSYNTVWVLLVQYSMAVARTIQYECYSYNTVWVLLVKYSMSVTRTIQYECYSCNTVHMSLSLSFNIPVKEYRIQV